MRILVTGTTGFAGGRLVEALLAQGGHRLAGVSRSAPPADFPIPVHPCDLRRIDDVVEVLRLVQPDQIHHLAGYPHVGKSFKEPDAAWEGNLTATRALYDAVLRWGGRPRILAVSSGLIYGDPRIPGDVLHEDSPLRPNSPYAASKAAMDLLGFQYAVSEHLDIVRVRPFNHLGPHQSPEFAVPSFARQLAEIRRGVRPPVIETGDLSTERDFSDVRDVVEAYIALMVRGRTGEAYNVASGTSRSMRAVLDEMIRLTGLQVEVRVRQDLLRRSEPQGMNVSVERLRTEIGRGPLVPFEQTLKDILDFWSRSA